MVGINYRTFGDLASCIKRNLHMLPDYDLVVGIPRSGMVPAYMIGMFLNKKVCSLDELINDIVPSSGYSREISTPLTVKRILIVDDSIHSGVALNKTKEKISTFGLNSRYDIDYLAIYAREQSRAMVDYYFEIVPTPRIFQWNYLNVKASDNYCYDIDGVLCVDPTEEENDDGEKYRHFLLNAKPLYIPNSKIYAIVTSRLEKYRKETEIWLETNGVRYDNLFMLNLGSKEERIKLKSHAKFKAEVYQITKASLFIESNDAQAREIAELTGKPCICVETDIMYEGNEVRVEEGETGVDYGSLPQKKILLLSHEFTFTGAPHSLLRIGKILLKNGYYVEVWGPRYGDMVNSFKKAGVHVRIIPYDDLDKGYVSDIAKYFDLSIVNTVISHRYYSFIRSYCPTIWYIREASNLPDICGNVPMREAALINADTVYCVSEYAQDFIKKRYNRGVRVLHNCVEDETGNLNCQKMAETGTVSFLQIGSITKRKAFDIYVQAYSTLPAEYKEKSHLYLAGQLIDSEKEFWKPLIKNVESDPHMTYLGEIKDDDKKWKIMCNMSIIVVASRDEACSLVALEGSMLSKPLILSENVGAKYIVNKKSGWIVETGSTEKLHNAMKEAIDKADELTSMGNESRKMYEKYSNMAIYEDEILKLVKKNMVDIADYRLSRRKQIKEPNIMTRGLRCLKYEGFRALGGKIIKAYITGDDIVGVCIIGTSASKMSVDLLDDVAVKGYIGKCSLMSQEYPRNYDDINILANGSSGDNFRIDFEKDMLSNVKKSGSSYLIIDLLDERFNLCRVKYACNSDVVVTKSDLLMKNLSKIEINGTVLMPEFVSIVDFNSIDYDKKIRSLCKKIRGVVSRKRIIINECYLATKYKDLDGKIGEFDEKTLVNVERINDKLAKLYGVLINSLPDCKVIKMPEWVTADKNHKQGLNPMQYADEYYAYIAKEVSKIVK